MISKDEEKHAYSSLAGDLTCLGPSVMSHASFSAPPIQQKIPRLRVERLSKANGMLENFEDLRPDLTFRTPSGNTNSMVDVVTFSDAAFNISTSSQYVQTCAI